MNQGKQHSARPFIVWVVIVLQFLLGLGALAGGGVLMADPSGNLIGMPFSLVHHSPFHNYLIPGMILFTFVGLFSVAVAYSLWQLPGWRWPNVINPFKGLHWSWAASLAEGVIVLIWITVEVSFTGVGFLHFLYWAWGLALIVLTLLPGVRKNCTLKRRRAK